MGAAFTDHASRITASASGPRSPVTRRSWEFALEAPSAGEDVTLTWPDLSGLGSKDRVMLEDLDTGARRSIRTAASYVFRPGESLRRRFRVTAEPRAAGPALISGLEVVSGGIGERANGRVGARSVRFVLSAPASVDVAVVSPAGRVVSPVARSRAASAGLNQVAWSEALAPGIYLVRVTATTDEGAQAQAVRAVVVGR